MEKHFIEDKESWKLFLQKNGEQSERGRKLLNDEDPQRDLRHHKFNPKKLEREKQREFEKKEENALERQERKREKEKKELEKRANELLHDSGILEDTVHGIMIDAGSTGTRLHVYEFGSRSLTGRREVEDALSGRKLTYPRSDARWTDRLKPGLSSFADTPDDELYEAIAQYLEPLMEFAQAVLNSKEDQFETYPIYLKATGGMRILEPENRARVMGAVRSLFYNKTYCPFWFEDERARVISGEEEAIFDWANVNFLMGTLIEDSEGAGTVIDPMTTYGALDMGGASTQISFYEPQNDIMANLFKLQIGQGRHWNVYCHSFLHYGFERATARLEARLASRKGDKERLVDGIHNPCLPGGATKEIRTNLYLDDNGIETWDPPESAKSTDGYYAVKFKNGKHGGDFEACMEVSKKLLHLEADAWCRFSHKGHCSFAGVFQPDLPTQSKHFGEFIAFSNFFHTWDFLQLNPRSSMDELKDGARRICIMSEKEVHHFNNGRIDDDEVNNQCFKAVFVYQVLRNGYGFEDDEYVTALNVINGLKVGWALGSMLYEINTLPWDYRKSSSTDRLLPTTEVPNRHIIEPIAISTITAVVVAGLMFFLFQRGERRRRYQYEPIGNIG